MHGNEAVAIGHRPLVADLENMNVPLKQPRQERVTVSLATAKKKANTIQAPKTIMVNTEGTCH